MDIRGRFANAVLMFGAVVMVGSVPLLLQHQDPVAGLPWITAMAVFLGAAAYTRYRLPTNPAAEWIAAGAGTAALVQGTDGVLAAALATDAPVEVLAWLTLTYHIALVATVATISTLFGLFPDGRPQTPAERVLPRLVWVFALFPTLALFSRRTLLFPSYVETPPVRNPYAIDELAAVGDVAGGLTSLIQAMFGVGVLLLAIRYRRSDPAERRRIRWLLLPAVGTLFAVLLDVVFHAPGGLLVVLYIGTMILVPLSIAAALLRPDLLDVDVVLRKSLVYGLLWLVIASAYVAAAAGLGVVAGQRFPVGMAITLTVVATLVFQPARQWLERLADRWVFGARTDPAQLVTRLGAALADTVELERLLPRMAATLEEGLALRWARVRLEPSGDPVSDMEPVLTVPIVLGDEPLGVVECGPKRTGPFTADDEAIVSTLARQAALAVRNVRLTAELQRSRSRLVRAQDAERRRIERNIHDGVQQDLVALMAHAGHARGVVRRDPAAGEAAVRELQEGLRRVISELRELAHGIHPSVLGDRGLLEAVEALAARSRLPVSVRANPALRGERFAHEIEGAGYFTVAEALANASKHASATRAEISLARSDGALSITVHDDGTGFDIATAVGEGLANLAERLAALGGRLDVASTPGQGTTVTAQLRVSGA